MPKVEPSRLPIHNGPDAAAPFGGPLGDYVGRAVSATYGLRQLGVNIETLSPGAASSHRHWHDRDEELVVVLSGTLTLIDDSGATELAAGDIAVGCRYWEAFRSLSALWWLLS